MSATACFHCGLPVPDGSSWRVRIDDAERAMCCPGCAAVAETIVATGLTDYYRTRSGFAAQASDACALPEALALYDSPELAAQWRTVDAPAGEPQGQVIEGVFNIEGLRCAACMWLIERHLARQPGVLAVDLNVARERITVRWDSARCKPSAIVAALAAIGYTAYPFDAERQGEGLERARKVLMRQLFVAGLAMMQVMNYVVAFYLDAHDGIDADMASLMRWASLVLTLPAVFYSARPFFAGAWRDLKNRMPGMDVPVALGIAAAFAGSVVATVRGAGEVYFDSVTMFIFLLLGSRMLELAARSRAAAALGRLQRAVPPSALLLAHWPGDRATELVPALRLAAGDVVLVKPGEPVPADGVVIEGVSETDQSLLTGESRAVGAAPGDAVPGGAVNLTQPLLLRVTRASRDSTLSMLVRLSDQAALAKPRLALWADRVAAWFVAALLVFALGVLAVWSQIDAARAWPIAIAVLVVSCPCALSLATPTALAAATDWLLRRGVLIVQPHVLETLQRATHIVFDKTGTLTLGRPELRAIRTAPGVAADAALARAAALEASSTHPLGRALIAAHMRRQGEAASVAPVATAAAAATVASVASVAPVAVATAVTVTPGQGIEGRIDGAVYRIGGAAFVAELAGAAPALSGTGAAAADDDGAVTRVWLAQAGAVLACFELADALRPEARAVVRHFRERGQTVALLSGDAPAVVRHVAAELGIDAGQAVGGVLPKGKLAWVQALQARGAVVAMVGDGVNDAAVLAAADVSCAMGGGAALAQLRADCVLLSGRLDDLRAASACAARTLAVIRQNLVWASLYNAVAIPAAALGWLSPWLSALGMSVSSAVVVLNALRLARAPRTVPAGTAAGAPRLMEAR